MNEQLIQKALFIKFDSHKYRFANVFYFGNESDFLTFLPNGYCYEVEIKISRSDFKADFKKLKHAIHTANGKKYYTVKGCEVQSTNPDWEFCRNFPELVICKDYTDEYSYRYNKRQMINLSYTAFSRVEFREFKNQSLPNKFFYAVPAGLISKEEVPDYAGLLHVNEDLSVTKVKDGKFIHRDILGPEKIFNKAYYAYERELSQKFRNINALQGK